MDAFFPTKHQQQVHYDQLPDGPRDKADSFQYQQQPPYEPYRPYPGSDAGSAPIPGPTILSVTRGVALSVVAVILLLFLAVVGLGAGLGVSQRDLRQAKGDLAAAQAVLSSASAAAPTATVSGTPTSATGSPSATPSAVSNVQCPRVNGTTYTASTGGKQFRRLCGLDYGGAGEAIDIGNEKTRSLDACIDACASRANCTGAGWGVMDGDKGTTHSCWMKTNLTKSHKAVPEWGFAVLVVQASTSKSS